MTAYTYIFLDTLLHKDPHLYHSAWDKTVHMLRQICARMLDVTPSYTQLCSPNKDVIRAADVDIYCLFNILICPIMFQQSNFLWSESKIKWKKLNLNYQFILFLSKDNLRLIELLKGEIYLM